jgi:hypothetical protein
LNKNEIRELIEILKAEGQDKLAEGISKKIEKNERITNSSVKQLKKLTDAQSKALNSLMKEHEKYQKQIFGPLSKADQQKKKELEDQIKSIKKVRDSIFLLIDAQDKETKAKDENTKSQRTNNFEKTRAVQKTREYIGEIRNLTSVLGILGGVVRAIESLYDTWFQAQSQLTRALGETAMATGATSRQLQDFRDFASSMRGSMLELNGSVVGWTESMQIARDSAIALRMDARTMVSELGENAQNQLLATQRGLGMSAQQIATLFRTIETGAMGPIENIGQFTLEIRRFSDEIGANASTMASDFLESRDSIQRFGEDGVRVFERTATYANRLGFETQRILQMAERFDRFGDASQNLNQLNAMFGTTISSIEMINEEDPVRRIQMITQAVRDQGFEWNQMNRYQQNALAESLGVSASEAARLMNGETMEEIEAQRAAEMQRQETFQRRQLEAQETLLDVIESTQTHFATIGDYLQRIWLTVAEAISPIFEAVRESSSGIVEAVRDWVKEISGERDFQDTIRDIANWIRELPVNIRNFLPVWRDIKKTGEELFPIIQTIGEVLMSVFNFAVEHPGIVAGALGVAAIIELVGGISSLSLLFSPAGALLVGAGLFAAAMINASEAAERTGDELNRINEIERGGGPLTEDESALRRDINQTTLNVLRGDTGVSAGDGSSLYTQGVRGLVSGAGEVLGAFGATQTSNFLDAAVASESLLASGDYRQLTQRAIDSGSSPRDIVSAMLGSLRDHPENEVYMRRSFNLSSNENLMNGLMREVSAMSLTANPPEETISIPSSSSVEAPSSVSSATDSAPSTRTTAATSSSSVAPQAPTIITPSEVILDGRRVGQIMFEIARRTQ